MREKEYGVISIQEIVYLVSFLILFGARAVGLYEGQLLYNIALVLGLLTWGIKILLTEHSLLEYIMIGFLVLLTLIIYKNTGEKGILLYFTMMLGMKNVSVKRVFKCGLGILSVSYVILVTLSLLGIHSEIMYIQSRSGWGNVFRHALGYPHPNTLHSTYVVLVALILYLVGKQSWKKLLSISLGLFFVSCYIYLYSGSRTGLLSTGIYLLINFWFQMRKEISFIEKCLIYLLYPACIIFSTIGPFVIKGKLYEIINKALSERWMLSVYYLENEPITLFGTRFKEAPTIHYMIDSSYLYSFLQLGVVAFCIITFMYICVVHKSVKDNARSELVLIVSFCIMGISDPFLFNLSYKNLAFIFIGKMVYDYLQEIDNRFPKLMKSSIQVLKIGNKRLKFQKIIIKNKNLPQIKWTHTVCVFVISVVMSTIFYMSVSNEPNAMYVSKTIWDDNWRRCLAPLWEMQVEEIFLTMEEVQELERIGELIYDYQNEGEPMYMIPGEPPRMEYIRNVASIGFWSGIFAAVFFWIFKYTMRRKSNGIE